MSDKEKFDEEEYHFVDDPDMGSFGEPPSGDPVSPNAEVSDKASSSEKRNVLPSFTNGAQSLWTDLIKKISPVWSMIKQNFLLRMIMLGIGVIVLILIVYRCSVDPLAEKTTEKMTPIPVIAPATQIVTPVVQPQVQTAPRIEESTKVVVLNQNAVQEKLNDFEKTQAGLQTQISALSSQLANMNSNVNTMMSNFKSLNEQLAQLTVTVQNQSKLAAVITPKKQPQRPWPRHHDVNRQTVQYSLQAVIPGRAWLISSLGDTLTVREGTKLAHYGVVRYIDAKRGRVLTSSGQLIQFGQNDS
ncbi:MAG: hypothetical protein CK424_07775 [Legionella sp.]|nr:MAG: hypothetical protein CK424_07775 [Legionella sp.]